MRASMHLWSPSSRPGARFPATLSLLLALALFGCDLDAPQPTKADNSDTGQMPSPIDFAALTGANFADPNTSPTCPFTWSCAPLPGEPTAHLRSGTCKERHFRVNADESRTFLNEHERTHRAGAWLTQLSEDNLDLEVTYSGNRIKSYKLAEGLTRSEATEVEYTYGRNGLTTVVALKGEQNVLDQSFEYDEEGRLLTDFTRRLIEEDSSISRTARHFQYTGQREREVWRDLDVDGQLSSPDKLQARHRWDEDGLLESVTDISETSSIPRTYTYSSEGLIEGITTTTAEMTSPLYSFEYLTPTSPEEEDQTPPVNADTSARIASITLGQNLLRLDLVRDDALALQRAQLHDDEDRLVYEVELEGSSCERTIHTWIQAMDHYHRDAQPPGGLLGQ